MRLTMLTLISCLFFLTACVGVPDGVEPVENFDANRYLGRWYEIARLDHRFERGLTQVSAEYRFNDDGSIKVINRGVDEEGQIQIAEGRAKFVETENIGHLKVSFFGPFYGSYVIFELESQYQYAFVSGNTKNYLWLLARQPSVSESTKQQFIESVERAGFNTRELIWVEQAKNL